MAVILALTRLFDAVVTRFASEAAAAQSATWTPAAIVVGSPYGLTINGHAVTYTALTDDTFAEVFAALYAQVVALGISGLGMWKETSPTALSRFLLPAGAPAVAFTAAVGGALANTTGAAGTPVPNRFGWREPAKRGASPRITWVPGDDGSGALGDVSPARAPGRTPSRPLGTLHELCTVYIEGVDASGLEDERKQYAATRILFDAWYRAVHLAAHGTFEIRSSGWVIETKERRHGAAIRVVLAIDAMLPDAALTPAPVDTAASVTPYLARDDDPAHDTIDTTTPDVITPVA
jgi:hypothetical protein